MRGACCRCTTTRAPRPPSDSASAIDGGRHGVKRWTDAGSPARACTPEARRCTCRAHCTSEQANGAHTPRAAPDASGRHCSVTKATNSLAPDARVPLFKIIRRVLRKSTHLLPICPSFWLAHRALFVACSSSPGSGLRCRCEVSGCTAGCRLGPERRELYRPACRAVLESRRHEATAGDTLALEQNAELAVSASGGGNPVKKRRQHAFFCGTNGTQILKHAIGIPLKRGPAVPARRGLVPLPEYAAGSWSVNGTHQLSPSSESSHSSASDEDDRPSESLS